MPDRIDEESNAAKAQQLAALAASLPPKQPFPG